MHYSISFLFMLLLVLPGCASYKVATQDIALPQQVEISDEEIVPTKEARAHWLYSVIPRHRSQIRWYDVGHWCTWALFGNDDDGIFGEDAGYRQGLPNDGSKALAWGLRNPFHNLCFYVIGSAHRSNSEFTILEITSKKLRLLQYHPVADRTYASKGSSFLLALHGGKPFASLRLAYTDEHTSDIYLGWRHRGNFGAKCLPWAKRKRQEEDNEA